MAYARGQYGKYGDIGKFGILREYGTPEIGDSIFNLAATDYGNTKIKTRKCADGSLPPCDEDVVTTSNDGCVYGRNADGSCKDPKNPTCADTGQYGTYPNCWDLPTGTNVTQTDQGNVFTHGTKYGMTDAKDIYGRTGADAFEKGAYLPNYSALYSGGASTGGQGPNIGVWTEGPYALEGPEKSLLGYNQLGQPTDPEFVRRMNEINDGTWSAEDEDRFVLERTLGGIDKSILEEGKAITDAYGDNPYKGLLAKEGEDFLKGAAGSGTKGYYTKMSKDYEDWYKEYQEAQEQLNFMRSQADKDRLMSGGILNVKKEYEQAEHELDRMADAGILSTAEVTNARRNLHQEENDAVKEVVEKSTGGDSGEEKAEKVKRKGPTKSSARGGPGKKTKAKTKTIVPAKTKKAKTTIYTAPRVDLGDPKGRKAKPRSTMPGGAPRGGHHF